MHYHILMGLLFFIGGTMASCTGTHPGSPVSDPVFAFTIDGVEHVYHDFTVSVDTIGPEPRIFLRKQDGADIYTFNFMLKVRKGGYPMSTSDGSSFFFASTSKGDFVTSNPEYCRLTVLRNDRLNRVIEASFAGVGLKSPTTESIQITNGMIRAVY